MLRNVDLILYVMGREVGMLNSGKLSLPLDAELW